MSSQILYFIFRRLVIEKTSWIPVRSVCDSSLVPPPLSTSSRWCNDCHDSSRVYRRLSDKYQNWELTYITYAIPYQHFWVDDFFLFPQVIDFMFVPSSKLLSLEPLSLAAGCLFFCAKVLHAFLCSCTSCVKRSRSNEKPPSWWFFGGMIAQREFRWQLVNHQQKIPVP